MSKRRKLCKNHPGERRLFDRERTEVYMKSILPILTKLGFVCRHICYHLGNEKIGTVDAVQKWLCQHGIPHRDRISPKEYELVALWASYAHVMPSAFSSKKYREYAEEEILEVLKKKLKIKETSDNRLVTSNESFVGTQEELRCLIRAEGCTALGRRQSVLALTDEEKVNLCVWGARSNEPLPVYENDEHDAAPKPNVVRKTRTTRKQPPAGLQSITQSPMVAKDAGERKSQPVEKDPTKLSPRREKSNVVKDPAKVPAKEKATTAGEKESAAPVAIAPTVERVVFVGAEESLLNDNQEGDRGTADLCTAKIDERRDQEESEDEDSAAKERTSRPKEVSAGKRRASSSKEDDEGFPFKKARVPSFGDKIKSWFNVKSFFSSK